MLIAAGFKPRTASDDNNEKKALDLLDKLKINTNPLYKTGTRKGRSYTSALVRFFPKEVKQIVGEILKKRGQA
jgi:hypothetical protein